MIAASASLGVVILIANVALAQNGDLITNMHPNNWTAPSLEDAFTILPCGAFRKNADGSWTLTGTLTTDSGETFANKTVANDDQAKALDSRCGDSQ